MFIFVLALIITTTYEYSPSPPDARIRGVTVSEMQGFRAKAADQSGFVAAAERKRYVRGPGTLRDAPQKAATTMTTQEFRSCESSPMTSGVLFDSFAAFLGDLEFSFFLKFVVLGLREVFIVLSMLRSTCRSFSNLERGFFDFDSLRGSLEPYLSILECCGCRCFLYTVSALVYACAWLLMIR